MRPIARTGKAARLLPEAPSMGPRQRHVDGAVLCGAGLVAGGLFVVAPWETGCCAAMLVTAARMSGRMSLIRALLVGLAVTLGAVRARAAVRHHDVARSLADQVGWQLGRCSARARVEASPVSVRGVLRWDGLLTNLSCDAAPRASTLPPTLATLYGGP